MAKHKLCVKLFFFNFITQSQPVWPWKTLRALILNCVRTETPLLSLKKWEDFFLEKHWVTQSETLKKRTKTTTTPTRNVQFVPNVFFPGFWYWLTMDLRRNILHRAAQETKALPHNQGEKKGGGELTSRILFLYCLVVCLYFVRELCVSSRREKSNNKSPPHFFFFSVHFSRNTSR
jgi:hypothetical protein